MGSLNTECIFWSVYNFSLFFHSFLYLIEILLHGNILLFLNCYSFCKLVINKMLALVIKMIGFNLSLNQLRGVLKVLYE